MSALPGTGVDVHGGLEQQREVGPTRTQRTRAHVNVLQRAASSEPTVPQTQTVSERVRVRKDAEAKVVSIELQKRRNILINTTSLARFTQNELEDYATATRVRARTAMPSVTQTSMREAREEALTGADLWLTHHRPPPEPLGMRPHHQCGICQVVKSHPVSPQKRRRGAPTDLDDCFADWTPVPDEDSDQVHAVADTLSSYDLLADEMLEGVKRKRYYSSFGASQLSLFQDEPVRLWQPLASTFLDMECRRDGLGDSVHHPTCDCCNAVYIVPINDGPPAVRLFRCDDCGQFLQCGDCLLSRHATNLLHILRLGLRAWIGFEGVRIVPWNMVNTLYDLELKES
ncbi:hypothetical protein C8J57DRAFT_1233814 [Mycena rebaudengoi]|nr:hypothetical protein C8J57DRAFT_1233814 [Mycena rebaudengoi]